MLVGLLNAKIMFSNKLKRVKTKKVTLFKLLLYLAPIIKKLQ